MEKVFKKNICCIGAGYVGGPTMSVIALNCPEYRIDVVDINQKIKEWNSNDLSDLPVFEPGLDKIIENCRGKNLFFSSNIPETISKADIIFISVNTQTKKRGLGANYASDLSWIESSAREIAKYASNHTIVVEKSTLPVKTAETIQIILNSYEGYNLNKYTRLRMSFLKQLPPKPGPAFKNLLPILVSVPIAFATSLIFAPVDSHNAEIELIEDIL